MCSQFRQACLPLVRAVCLVTVVDERLDPGNCSQTGVCRSELQAQLDHPACPLPTTPAPSPPTPSM